MLQYIEIGERHLVLRNEVAALIFYGYTRGFARTATVIVAENISG